MVATRELLLLRHGIAEERRVDLPEWSRALTPEGRQRTEAVLQRLLELGLGCDLLLSSPSPEHAKRRIWPGWLAWRRTWSWPPPWSLLGRSGTC